MGDTSRKRRENRDTDWGRFAYMTLGLLTVAAFWALTLSSLLVHRSGQTGDELAAHLAGNHALRQAALDELRRSRREAHRLGVRADAEPRRARSKAAALREGAHEAVLRARAAHRRDVAGIRLRNTLRRLDQVERSLAEALVQPRRPALVPATGPDLAPARAPLRRAGAWVDRALTALGRSPTGEGLAAAGADLAEARRSLSEAIRTLRPLSQEPPSADPLGALEAARDQLGTALIHLRHPGDDRTTAARMALRLLERLQARLYYVGLHTYLGRDR